MERISAFMDGEVEGQEAAAQLARIKGDPALRQTWDTYHLIGDAMRGDGALSPRFMGRFHEALAEEPTVLAPMPMRSRQRAVRIALSMAASIGGVALVGWLALSNNPLMPRDQNITAVAPVAVPVVAKSTNGEVNDYIEEHQGVVSYVRTVAARERDLR